MSRPIQVIPPGFLGFLQLKNAGRNPTELPDALSPVLDMFGWYMEGRMTSQFTGSLAVAVTGWQGTIYQVPADQYWWVENITFHITQTGADTVRAVPAMVRDAASIATPFTCPGTVYEAFAGVGVSLASAGGFFVPNGWRLGLFVQSLAGAGAGQTSSLRYTALPI